MILLMSVLLVLGVDTTDTHEATDRLASAQRATRAAYPSPGLRAVELKSPRKALLYSALGSLAPAGAGTLLASLGDGSNDLTAFTLITGGVLVGPAAGHFYADNRRQAWVGIGLRTTGSAAMVAGTTLIFDDLFDDDADTGGSVLVLTGLILTGSSFLYDIFSAPKSARQYNQRQSLSVHPQLDPVNETAGLRLAWRF